MVSSVHPSPSLASLLHPVSEETLLGFIPPSYPSSKTADGSILTSFSSPHWTLRTSQRHYRVIQPAQSFAMTRPKWFPCFHSVQGDYIGPNAGKKINGKRVKPSGERRQPSKGNQHEYTTRTKSSKSNQDEHVKSQTPAVVSDAKPGFWSSMWGPQDNEDVESSSAANQTKTPSVGGQQGGALANGLEGQRYTHNTAVTSTRRHSGFPASTPGSTRPLGLGRSILFTAFLVLLHPFSPARSASPDLVHGPDIASLW